MITSSLEEYLKTMYVLKKQGQDIKVTTIANKMNCTKPSVNKAIRNLKLNGLVNYEVYGDIELTQKGEQLAKKVLEAYDIVNVFLTEILEVPKEEAERKLQYEDFIIEEKEESGYVRRVKICGTSMSGEQFRNFLGLASSAFEFQKGEEDRLKIVTMGNGHGLGLSQWTAQEMAKEGKSCEEILNYFFEGTKIEEKEEICDLPQKKE